jgi:hypothetical protein
MTQLPSGHTPASGASVRAGATVATPEAASEGSAAAAVRVTAAAVDVSAAENSEPADGNLTEAERITRNLTSCSHNVTIYVIF